MGLVEEPVVGKPERLNRSWAIVCFKTTADKKAFIENHLEWFDDGYGKELVADGYEPLVKEVRPTPWIRNNGLGKMPVGECILFSENHEKKKTATTKYSSRGCAEGSSSEVPWWSPCEGTV